MKATPAFFFILAAFSVFAEKQPISRYQTVIDRQMFGALPRDFDPTKMPSEVAKANQKELTKEQEKLKSAVHFSVINVTPSGDVEVGFSDLSDPTSPMHYFLKVGETQNGWTVEKADAATATATLVKDDIVLDLSLGDNSAKGGGAAKRADASPSDKSAELLNASGGTWRERRQKREEMRKKWEEREEERRKAEEQKREEDRAERAELREMLMEQIRQNKQTKAADKPEGISENESNDN